MDHVGQLDYEGRIMAQVIAGGVDHCDNTPHPEPHNLNELNPLTQTEHTSALKNDSRTGLPSKASLNNNGENKEELEGHKSTSKEEEEDTDELMKDEEEESEASSCLMHCQSPDTPMTDSSNSETGSLLENPFSPGTSPEPTSPVLQETSCPTSPLEVGQSEVDLGGFASSTSGDTLTTGPLLSPHLSFTSDTSQSCTDGPEHVSSTTARNAQSSTSAPLTTSSPPIEGLVHDLHLETTSNIKASITSHSQTAEPFAFSTGQIPTGAQSVSETTLRHSDECTSSSVPISALMASLEHLAQRGDDDCLPQDLHWIAEASVCHEDYQLALQCIQLERLYHQRVLDNLNALQQQWESRCIRSQPSLEARHLDTLRDICQTHTRPNAADAAPASLGVRHLLEQGDALPPQARHIEGTMENRAEDSSCPQSSHPPSINLSPPLDSPNSPEKDREAPKCNLEGTAGFHGTELSDEVEGIDGEQGECLERTTSALGDDLHPSEAGQMDQTKPAEQQGGDLVSAQEKEVDREDDRCNVEEAAEAPMMEDEAEEEEEGEEKRNGIDVDVEHLHQETQVAEKEEICQKEGNESSLQQDDDGHLPQEAFPKHPKLASEEEEQEEYENEKADIFPEAVTLDDMAKLITIEEISPAYGLISILKKKNLPSDEVSLSASPESISDKPTAKRRVRFKVADDGFDSDVGGRDSCLLLFLLCLVTVVISMGGTTLYCALGDVHSSVCQDFSRNVDFYFGQMQRAIAQIHQWLGPSPS
ncbi:consortin isoform X2 [Syngnathus acus]|uniref:consortin isoform X2 n=1 Tax=Syngnathus acus TaxID=161584 RepID=UPI0018862DFB|nr:consortin isoform X2 [Syngnathus acus]